ncbi:MAG TPA: glycosyltransferase family 4 protein [Pyrinomonadaceae bacterium]|nr:glycosyltransferase family 4 protein [Pyrinomonadaceae bacterium]
MEEAFILQVSLEIGLGGGSECVAYELQRAWLALGHDARVFASLATEPDRQGVTYVAPWLTAWGMRARWRHLAALIAVPLFTLIASWRAYRARGTKVILSHGDSLIGDVCVVHAVNRASLVEKRRAGYYGWLLNPSNLWVTWRDWWMLRGGRYRRIVAISERVRAQLKEHYNVPEDRIVTIPNGINLSRFDPSNVSARKAVRAHFNIPEDAALVLFVGSQYRLKGLEFAIRAMAELKTQAYLLVVGGDSIAPFKRLAEQLGVADRVIFAGARSDLPSIYPAADAFVLPTLYETFALVCIEAMASGLPVLACPVGGIEDYLRDGDNGLHIRREAGDIAAKLDRVLGDPQLRKRLSDNGLATAKNYAWNKIAKQYLALFDEVLAEKARHLPGSTIAKTSVSTQSEGWLQPQHERAK